MAEIVELSTAQTMFRVKVRSGDGMASKDAGTALEGDMSMLERPNLAQVSRDGNTLLIGSKHGILLMRGQATATRPSQVATAWLPVRESVRNVLLSGDGNILTFISDEKIVQLDTSLPALARKARGIAHREMSEVELLEYGKITEE